MFGAALGGLLTFLLVFSWTDHWLVWLPTIFGGLVGLWKGDRALFGLLKVIGWFPG